MTKRRSFMVSFSFPAERAGDFFQSFPWEYAENFECTTVDQDESQNESEVRTTPATTTPVSVVEEPHSKAQHPFHSAHTPEELPDLPEAYSTPTSAPGPRINPGNPTTSQQARDRFRMDERGTAPSAREILIKEFSGKESFMVADAVQALKSRGLSKNTAAPTLNNMKYKGQAEHISQGKFRITVPRHSSTTN